MHQFRCSISTTDSALPAARSPCASPSGARPRELILAGILILTMGPLLEAGSSGPQAAPSSAKSFKYEVEIIADGPYAARPTAATKGQNHSIASEPCQEGDKQHLCCAVSVYQAMDSLVCDRQGRLWLRVKLAFPDDGNKTTDFYWPRASLRYMVSDDLGLTWAFTDINTFTRDDCADRALYAEFLDEASLILNRPSLREATERFRSSAEAWGRLSLALLPDEIQLFKETRQLLLERHELFRVKGGGARPKIVEINTRLKEIKANVAAQFPLSPIEVGKLRENLASHVEAIAKIETEAVQLLTDVLQK